METSSLKPLFLQRIENLRGGALMFEIGDWPRSSSESEEEAAWTVDDCFGVTAVFFQHSNQKLQKKEMKATLKKQLSKKK